MRDIYINFNLNQLIKFTGSSGSTKLKDFPMEHLSNDQKERHNQHENSHKLYDETGQPVLSLMKSQ